MWIVNSFEWGIRTLCHINTNELARIQGEKCKHWTVPLGFRIGIEFGHGSFYLEWKNHSWWRAWVDFILFKLKTQFEFMTCTWVAQIECEQLTFTERPKKGCWKGSQMREKIGVEKWTRRTQLTFTFNSPFTHSFGTQRAPLSPCFLLTNSRIQLLFLGDSHYFDFILSRSVMLIHSF